MPQSKPKSMKEIAERLGTTAVSVSLALRNSPRVSEELRNRILKLVEESGFVARNYPRKRTSKYREEQQAPPRIGILYRDDSEDPVATTIQTNLMRQLAELRLPFEALRRDDAVKNPALLADFDGFLYDYSIKPENLPLLAGKPQVAVMNDEVDCGDFDSCKSNDYLAGKLAANYLLKTGFQNIILIWEVSNAYREEFHPRIVGFLNQMREADQPVKRIRYYRHDGRVAAANQLRDQLKLFDGTAGIFTFCDMGCNEVCMMLEFLGFKRETGKLEVVSCDNTYLLRSLRPPVTAVDLHYPAITAKAVELLLWRIRNPKALRVDIQIRPDLIQR